MDLNTVLNSLKKAAAAATTPQQKQAIQNKINEVKKTASAATTAAKNVATTAAKTTSAVKNVVNVAKNLDTDKVNNIVDTANDFAKNKNKYILFGAAGLVALIFFLRK